MFKHTINSDAFLQFLEEELRIELSYDNETDNDFVFNENERKEARWFNINPLYIFLIIPFFIYFAMMPLFLFVNLIIYIKTKIKGEPFKLSLPPPGPAKAIELIDNKIKIEIRHKEHAPPHFHVVIDSDDFSFNIITGELLHDSSISQKKIKKIKKWYKSNKSKLIKVWNATRPSDCQVGKIK